MSKVYEYYESRGEVKMCAGDCGNVYSLEDLYSTCYTQDFCKDCMCTFLTEQEDGKVYDAITGEE